jgi:hypothetical protein
MGKDGRVVLQGPGYTAPTALPNFMLVLTPKPPLRSDFGLRTCRTSGALVICGIWYHCFLVSFCTYMPSVVTWNTGLNGKLNKVKNNG